MGQPQVRGEPTGDRRPQTEEEQEPVLCGSVLTCPTLSSAVLPGTEPLLAASWTHLHSVAFPLDSKTVARDSAGASDPVCAFGFCVDLGTAVE